jgi:WD40 repeat protein
MKYKKSKRYVIYEQIFIIRVWVVIVALLAGILSCAVVTEPRRGSGAGGEDRPFGQLAREDLGAPVWSLAISADGAYLASATITGDVWLNERSTGRVVRLESGPWSSVQSLAFAPASHILAVAGVHPAVRLWDVDTGKELVTFEVRRRFAKSVVFSTDGALLAVSERGGDGAGGVIALWDWRKGRRLATLEGHRGVVNALAFSADGSLLASGDSQGNLKLWDLAMHRERTSLRPHEIGRGIQALAFSPDGTLLATAALLDREVRLWDAATGVPRGMLPAPTNGVNGLAFSPHGPTLAMARGDGVVALWDVVRRRELGVMTTRGATLQSVVCSPDGHQLATGGADGALRIWDLLRLVRNVPSAGPPDVAP